MTYYNECEHETNGIIIMESSIISLSAYFVWAESVGVFGERTICWECFCKKRFGNMKEEGE